MGTKVQYMKDYIGYIKCGEVLKSPFKNYENPFILKCFECEEIHFLLESFIIHIQEHYKDELKPRERVETRTRNGNKKQKEEKLQEMEDQIFPTENQIFPTENLVIKLEDNAAMDMEDPLTEVKSEDEDVKEDVKEELEEFQDLNKSSDIDDHHDDFEEIFVDSADEYQPNENHHHAATDTDSDEEEEESTGKSKKKPKRVIKETSPFIEMFMLSESNVTALIEAYKNKPNLWNKDFPHFRNKEKKQQILEELTQHLNDELKLNLTREQLSDIISHICGKHRDDYKRLQKHDKKDKKVEKKYKTVWFYDLLEFLRPKVKIQLQNLDAQLPDLTSEQIIQILAIYKECAHLWNSNLIEYICSNKRNEAYASMLKMLETNMNLTITRSSLEVYLNAIHKYFSKEKRLKADKIKEDTEAAAGAATTATDSNKDQIKPEVSSNSPDYYEHMMFLYDHEGPFNCSVCNTTHSKPLLFKIHKSQHESAIPFKCSQCSKELKTIPSYISHAKRHYEDFEFGCDQCERRFFNQQELKMHMMTHTGAQPYCCEICGASFRYSNSLKKHQRRHAGTHTHTCHICSKGFYSKYRYNDHINSHLGIRQFICKVCSKAFITSRALKTHMVTHDDARNHACKLCGKTFKLKIGVLQHMRTHGNNVGIDDKYHPH